MEQQSELLGHKIDERFELYRNTMLIYKKGMQPETIDKLACSMDILPTLSNLFGLDFDSRLYMGHDIFSDATPLVVFSDRSWLTEFVSYYAPTGQVTMLGDFDVSSQLIAHYNEIVSNKFLVSEWILEEDYWRTLFGDNLPPDDWESTDALLPSVEGEETVPKGGHRCRHLRSGRLAAERGRLSKNREPTRFPVFTPPDNLLFEQVKDTPHVKCNLRPREMALPEEAPMFVALRKIPNF